MENSINKAEDNCCESGNNDLGEHASEENQRIKKRMDTKRTIFIWDMDETLIILKSLLSGIFAEKYNGSKDVQHGKKIGRRWESLILKVCDEHFFYEQVENFNEPHLETWREYDDGSDLTNYDFGEDGLAQPFDDANRKKLAYRFRSIGNKYAQGLHGLLDSEQIQLWQELYNVTDAYTDGWLSAARSLLEDCLRKGTCPGSEGFDSGNSQASASNKSLQNVNVLVTSGTLIPSLVKCMLFRLDDLIPAENVYSAWDVGKMQCFLWIKKRFEGPDTRFCVIGDSMEECEAAEGMGWPFIEIDHDPQGTHRFPGLSLSTVRNYLHCVYTTSESDDD
eukprot:TRINITY_DN2751_c0_g1_i1.p1 TRINITY_DN2751_c0_g1~~TRINITY_DN2751_c0_g1_i1.p1  ORF type:complete len:335 (-),score=63.84 TRINITY_DN2751_c0_g1_i1:75-1079(-)